MNIHNSYTYSNYNNYAYLNYKFSLQYIAKLSPSFSFNWTEMVINLDLPHPPTPTRESINLVLKCC